MGRSVPLLLENPGDGFGGQPVEGLNAESQVVFASVFDFVVADAAQGLYEEHDRGNAGARDFGGVVERAGGHAMRRGGNFADSLFAKIEQRGMEGDGLDVPDARPFDGALFFFGEAVAGFLSFAEHLRENLRVEVALIEGGFAAAHHRSDDAGEGFHAAHGADGVGMLARDMADFEGEFGGGRQRVTTILHGCGAGMRFLTVEGDEVALDSLSAKHSGERKIETLEDGALLDVEFEIRGGVLAFLGGFGEPVDLDAAAAQRVFEFDAIAIGADAVRRNRMCTRKGGRAEQATAEARAFFVGPVDDTNGDGRLAVEFVVESAKNLEGGNDVERAVEPATIGHGIEVATDEKTFFGCTGESDPVVARGVVMMFDGEAL